MTEREPGDPGATPEPSGDAPAAPEPTPTEPTPTEPTPTEPTSAAGDAAAATAAAGATGAAAGAGTPAPSSPPPPTTPPTSTTTTAGPTGGDNRTLLLLGLAVIVIAVIAALLLLNQGNGESGATPEPSASASAEASASPEASPSEEPSPEPSLDACAIENLAVATAGQLTVGTDNPAYPPYFEAGDGPFTEPWEDLGFTGDPGSGKGFESAVAYAVAEELGFGADEVSWVVVPFANAFAPGPKEFDFVINQVSYKPERAEAVDLTEGYYELNQAVVALKDNPAAAATTLAELKAFKFGAQVGTTSYDAIINVIAPATDPSVYDTNDAAIEALKAKQIDAIVVDLPTSDFITRVQIDDGSATIVGQLEPFGGTPEYFSLVIEKDSALTDCVNAALGSLRDAGALDDLAAEWLPFQEDVPFIK